MASNSQRNLKPCPQFGKPVRVPIGFFGFSKNMHHLKRCNPLDLSLRLLKDACQIGILMTMDQQKQFKPQRIG